MTKMSGFDIPSGDEHDRMPVPGWPDRFRNGCGIVFERPVTRADAAWWCDRFVENHDIYPDDLARMLSLGTPGQTKSQVYESISALNGSFSLKREGCEGNRRIWFHSAQITVVGNIFEEASFYQDRLGVATEFRGQRDAQKVMRPIADLARILGIKRIGLDAQDIGGHLWAEAGALPKGSTVEIQQQVLRRAERLRRRAEITIELQDRISDMLEAGHVEPRMLWAIAKLPQLVKSTHARNPMDPDKIALGKELLIGVNWKAEIDLENRFSRLAFKKWLRKS